LRKNILKAASHEFLERGYENFSLRRVAERIGYTPTTIYLYFRNKDDLLHGTVLEGFQEFDAQIAHVAASHRDPLKRVEALGNFYVQFGMDNPALYRLMFMQRSDLYLMPRFHEDDANAENLSPIDPQGQTPRVLAQELLVQALEEAMKNGSMEKGDAKLKADVLWVGVHGLVSLAISPLISAEYAPMLKEELIRTLIRGTFSS
jgi:AcrR family transcriptional regulator